MQWYDVTEYEPACKLGRYIVRDICGKVFIGYLEDGIWFYDEDGACYNIEASHFAVLDPVKKPKTSEKNV